MAIVTYIRTPRHLGVTIKPATIITLVLSVQSFNFPKDMQATTTMAYLLYTVL